MKTDLLKTLEAPLKSHAKAVSEGKIIHHLDVAPQFNEVASLSHYDLVMIVKNTWRSARIQMLEEQAEINTFSTEDALENIISDVYSKYLS